MSGTGIASRSLFGPYLLFSTDLLFGTIGQRASSGLDFIINNNYWLNQGKRVFSTRESTSPERSLVRMTSPCLSSAAFLTIIPAGMTRVML